MNPVGGIFAMGMLFWIGYAVAMTFMMMLFGILIIVVFGIIGFVYYIMNIGRCLRENDAKGAWMLFMAPALMAGVSLVATAIWYYGGPSFLSSILMENMSDGDEGGVYVILFPLGLFVNLGWIIPLVYAHKYVDEGRKAVRSPGAGRLDRIFLNPAGIYVTAIAWGILGGSTWAVSGIMTGGTWSS